MNQTENINELVAALSKAQGAMQPAKFNKINPHFKNRYADFTSCMDACREPLSNNGLSIMQYCEMINEKPMLVTMLAHISGQWIKSNFPLLPKTMDSQGIGSAMTYGKRYCLSAMLGIVSDDEDDDAEAASGRGKETKPTKPVKTDFLPEPIKLVDANQSLELLTLKLKLDSADRKLFDDWIDRTYMINSLEQLPESAYEKVLLILRKKVPNEVTYA